MTNPQFNGMSDCEVYKYLTEHCRFIEARKLESGEWVGVLKLMFTTSVCTDIGYNPLLPIAGALKIQAKQCTSLQQSRSMTKSQH